MIFYDLPNPALYCELSRLLAISVGTQASNHTAQPLISGGPETTTGKYYVCYIGQRETE
jgi:hypothetical protein